MGFCVKCGNKLNGNTKFCPKCGFEVKNVNLENTNNIVINQNNNTCMNNNSNNRINLDNVLKRFNDNNSKSLAFVFIVLAVLFIFVGFAIEDNIHLSKNGVNDGSRTFMIYIDGSNLESDLGIASSDIASMDPKKIDLKHTNILLYTGGTSEWKNFIKNDENAIYQLTKNGFVKVKKYEQKNMGDADTLSTFLNFAYDNYKTEKYDLVFYDHGGAIDGAIYDDFTSDNLSLKEMRKALSNSPFNSQNKLETVMFRTCLNATIEVANSFSNYSDYLIASEEVTYGSYMSTMFNFINDLKPKDSVNKFGKQFIDEYVEYIDFAIDENHTMTQTYSIINLNKLSKVNTTFDDFIKDISNKSNYNKISKVRASLFQFGSDSQNIYDSVDMYQFVKGLRSLSPNKADKVLNAIEDSVEYNYSRLNNTKGISIYFPYNSANSNKQIRFIIYSSLNYSSNYDKLINDFDNYMSDNKTSGFSAFDSTTSKNSEINKDTKEFQLKLSDEEIKDFSKAGYIIFEKNGSGEYSPIYMSDDAKLGSDGILKTNLSNNMITITDQRDNSSEYLPVYKLNNNSSKVLQSFSMLKYFDSELFDFKLYSARTYILLKKDKPVIDKHIYSRKNDAGVQEVSLDEEDFTSVDYLIPTYKIVDENGNYTSNWESSDSIYYISVEPGKYDLKYSNLDSKGEYYCLFKIFDVKKQVHYSNLVKIN